MMLRLLLLPDLSLDLCTNKQRKFAEGVTIGSSKAEWRLNSKVEWHSAKIPWLQVEVGTKTLQEDYSGSLQTWYPLEQEKRARKRSTPEGAEINNRGWTTDGGVRNNNTTHLLILFLFQSQPTHQVLPTQQAPHPPTMFPQPKLWPLPLATLAPPPTASQYLKNLLSKYVFDIFCLSFQLVS